MGESVFMMLRARFTLLIQFLSLALVSTSAQVLDFGPVNVGTAAPPQTFTYSYNAGKIPPVYVVDVLTTGASGLDYTDGGTTCTTGVNVSVRTTGNIVHQVTCNVSVAFAPSAPGLRAGAVMLFESGSNQPVTTWLLTGVGQSGTVTIDPGTQSTIATLSNSFKAYGAALDGAGDLYVVDQSNNRVTKLSAGTFTKSTVVASASGLSGPTAIALDGAGNLYISDTGNSRVVMVPNEQRGLNCADMTELSIPGLVTPGGLAIDGSGNLYVADSASGNLLELPAGSDTPITVVSNLTNPTAIALDAGGNLYVTTNNSVTEYQPPFSGTPIPIGGGYSNVGGVAVDASGAVYVADTGNAQIVKVAPGGASQSTMALAGLSAPQGVLLDAAGNIYITDGGNVYEVNRTQAAPLIFGNAFIGSTSAPQTLTVSDAGNQPLNLSNLAITANFTQVPSGGTDCTTSTQLSSAGQCLIAVATVPTISGSLTGTLTLTNDALNNPASAQTVQLSTNGVQVAQSISFPAIPTQTYGVGPLTLNATSTSGLLISYKVISGSATISGNVLTITGAGPVTVQACQVGDVEYAAATPVSQTFAVNPAATTIAWSNPAAITYGTPLCAVQLDATATPISSGTYVYTPALGTVLNAGSQTLSVQFTPSDPNYAPSTASVTLQVNPAATTIAWSNPAAITYGTPLSATQLNAKASPICAGTFVYTPPLGMVLNAGSQTLSVQFTPTSANYISSTGNVTLQVNPAAPTVVWSPPAAITYGTALSVTQLNATATPVSAGTYVYNPALGTVPNGGSQTLSVQFTPTDSNYASSNGSTTLQVNQASQTVKFTQKAPAQASYGSNFTVVATATSGLAVSYSSSGIGPCTEVTNADGSATYTIGNTSGNCKVTANQAGNGNYLAATSVTEYTAATALLAPTVTFTGAPASSPYNSTFTVVATSNSGVTPTLTTSGSCSISGTTVTITLGSGTCTMTANWAANSTYQADTATQTTTATKATPTVTFTGAPATAGYQSTFTVAATSNSGVNPSFTAMSACSISGTTVTITSSSGTCTTTANWAANSLYLATSLTQTTTAQQGASVITWPTPATITYPAKITATQLDATANVAGKFVYTPPSGTVLYPGSQTLSTQFTPTSNNFAPATATVTLTVNDPRNCSPTYQSGSSGPPNYGGLRNDPCVVTVSNIPNLWTNFSADYGYTGAGTVTTNSMGLQVLRVTDGNTDPAHPGGSYINNYSGGDSDEHWAIDHSMFTVGRNSANVSYVYLFNGSTMQATQLQNAGKPFTLPSYQAAFGQTTPNAYKVWILGASSNCTKTGPCAILQYDLTACLPGGSQGPTACNPPTPTTIYDFQQGTTGVAGANCLAGLNVTWAGQFRVSTDDTLFAMGFSNAGLQGTGTIVAGYQIGNGCRVWNTGTSTLNLGPTVGGIPGGYVVGEFPAGAATPQPMTMTGCAGGYNCPGGTDQFTLHGANTIPANNLIHLSATACLAGSCTLSSTVDNDSPYIWNFPTLQSFSMGGSGSQLSGHECYGYNSLVYGSNSPQGQDAFIALISAGGLFTPSTVKSGGNSMNLIAPDDLAAPYSLNLDTHCGWNADNVTDTMPILQSSTTVCLGNPSGQLTNQCTPTNNKPNNGCVIPADIASSSWPSSGPNCGSGNPFTGPYVNEVDLYQTNVSPGNSTAGSACLTTNGSSNTPYSAGATYCSGNSPIRLGSHGISAMNPIFNAQNATIDWSPDGLFYTVTTDWWCTFGASTLGQDTICGGVEWEKNTAYSVGDIITPQAGNAANCTYTASGTPPLVSGSMEPTGWGTLTGGVCPAQIPATGLDGNITWIRVGAIGIQNARSDVIVGSMSTN